MKTAIASGLLVMISAAALGISSTRWDRRDATNETRLVDQVSPQEEPITSWPVFKQWLASLTAAAKAGGLQMGTTGFHRLPLNAIYELGDIPVPFHRYADGTLNDEGVYGTKSYIQVEVTPDSVLPTGISGVSVVSSILHPGLFDVRVQFSDTVYEHCVSSQALVDGWRQKIAASPTYPDPQGSTLITGFNSVALVHGNVVYADLAYGAIASAIQSSTPITIAYGLSLQTATKIQDQLPQ